MQILKGELSDGRIKFKNYHEIRLRKYPFTIIYFIEEDEQLIIISAIYYNKRNPKKKYRRLL